MKGCGTPLDGTWGFNEGMREKLMWQWRYEGMKGGGTHGLIMNSNLIF